MQTRMPKAPTVTVIIPSYNYAMYLPEAVESVLTQTWPDFELLVVDDGSQDTSFSVAQEFARRDARVRTFQHPSGRNRGLAATLQLGLGMSRGIYVAVLEADDSWHPSCLEKRMLALQETDAGIVFNSIEPIYEAGYGQEWFEAYVLRVMEAHRARVQGTARGRFGPFAMRGAFLVENQIPTLSCAMIRRSLLEECDFYSPVPQWVDRWVWGQAALKTEFAFVPQRLTCWRLHSQSYTCRSRESEVSVLKSAFEYMRRNSSFWRALRKRLGSEYRNKGDGKFRIFLNLPAAAGIGVRIVVMARFLGVGAAIRKCFKKLGIRRTLVSEKVKADINH